MSNRTNHLHLTVARHWGHSESPVVFSLDKVTLRQYLDMHWPTTVEIEVTDDPNDELNGTYIGRVEDISETLNVFAVELM